MTDIKVTRIPFDDIPQLSSTDKDYAQKPEIFKALISAMPTLEGFEQSH